MAGSIKIKDIWGSRGEPDSEEAAINIVRRAKEIAISNGIVPPKNPSVHGAWDDWICFNHNTNAFRDCLIEAIIESGSEIIRMSRPRRYKD